MEEPSSYQSVFVQLAVVVVASLAGVKIGELLFSKYGNIVKSVWWKELKRKILLRRNHKREVSIQEELNGFTRLHRACEDDDFEGVKASASPLNINQQCYTDYNQKGYDWEKRYKTPLILACENGNTAIVSFLCSYEGIDPNISYLAGNTALHVACKMGNEKNVEALLSCGGLDVNKKNNRNDREEAGASAIEIAYSAGHRGIVVLLLAHDQIDPTGVLALACKQNDKDMFDLLIKHKNTRKFLNNSEAICAACEVGNAYMVEELLKLNSNNCMKLGVEYTKNPLHVACERGSEIQDESIVEIIKMLCKHQFINPEKDTVNGKFAMVFAIPNCSILNLLPKANVHNLYWSDGYQHSLLERAVKKENIPCVLWFLDNGADIRVGYKSQKGRIIASPFASACRRANEKDGKHSLQLIAAWLEWQRKHENGNLSQETKYVIWECLSDSIVTEKKDGASIYEYLHDVVTGWDPYDYAVQKLLVKYGDFRQESPQFSSLALKASHCNLGLLNFFISYGGSYPEQDTEQRTPLFNAFMSEILTRPDELTFFRKLGHNEKKAFIAKELTIATQFTLKHIAGYWVYEQGPEYCRRNNHEIENVEKKIKNYNRFIAMCFKHGACDTALCDELLKAAYNTAKTEKQHFCAQLPVHAFVPHIRVVEKRHKIDQAVAISYANNPMEYYLKPETEKENLAEIMARRLAIN